MENTLTQDWTFAGENTRDITHCYHDYPARMIPQVAGNLLDIFGGMSKREKRVLFDPYSGSGTSLVEGVVRGFSALGTDLNPLARLISSAKIATPDKGKIENCIKELCDISFMNRRDSYVVPSIEIKGISRIDFWFKSGVIKDLFFLREFINKICDDVVRLFFQVAFSETVRECSNTRRGEFKLLRYKQEKLSTFSPDVVLTMIGKLERNLSGLNEYLKILGKKDIIPEATVCGFNTVLEIPADKIGQDSVDIVVTSPPYGDSGTTVAYGQYSRLSSSWLELEEPEKVDKKLMGGTKIKLLPIFPSCSLNSAIENIFARDDVRALEVASFYSDLLSSISNVSSVIKCGGYACYVVGNRKVKGVVLPTDSVIADFFEFCGLQHVDTFIRSIPNKRMPLKNCPSNISGESDDTMTKEYVVIMRKPCR